MSIPPDDEIRWSDTAEKKAISEALQYLPDIRKAHADNNMLQSQLLMRSHPDKYDAEIVRRQLSRDGSNQKVAEDMRAIDLSLVLGRHLLAYVKPEFRQHPNPQSPDPELRQMAKDEDRCLLVQLMWKDYEPRHNSPNSGPKPTEAQSLLRWCAARQIAKYLEYDRVEDLRFLVIMESGLMRQVLWVRNSFLLRAPSYLTRLADSPHLPWNRCDADDRTRRYLALNSLIEWDGVQRLQAIFSKRFGKFSKTFKNGKRRDDQKYETNHTSVVRMWYKPTARARKTFTQLKKLQFKTYHFEAAPGKMKLVLAAIVHFRRPNGRGDALRMYNHDDGEQVHVQEDMAYLEDDGWRMGDEDEGEYMLYYVPAPSHPLKPTRELKQRGPSAREMDLDFDLADQPVSGCEADQEDSDLGSDSNADAEDDQED
ncbi:hypothetical protein PG988_013574 [Apiospora saccharicola]